MATSKRKKAPSRAATAANKTSGAKKSSVKAGGTRSASGQAAGARRKGAKAKAAAERSLGRRESDLPEAAIKPAVALPSIAPEALVKFMTSSDANLEPLYVFVSSSGDGEGAPLLIGAVNRDLLPKCMYCNEPISYQNVVMANSRGWTALYDTVKCRRLAASYRVRQVQKATAPRK